MRLTVINRLSFSYFFTIILLVFFAAALFQSAERLRSSLAAADHGQQVVTQLQGLLVALIGAENAARGYTITRNDEFFTAYRGTAEEIPTRLARLGDLVSHPEQQERFAALRELTERRLGILTSAMDERRVEPAGSPLPDLRRGKASMDAARVLINAMIEEQNEAVRREQASAVDSTGRASMILVFGGLLVVGGVIAVAAPTLLSVRHRLAVVAEGTRKLGAGDLGHRVDVRGNDELSDLARGFNTMAQKLQESNAALDAFAYTVSHDLRAPLRAMQGFSKALLEDYGEQLGNQGKDYATRIVAAAARMDELIQDLLAYSRLSRADLAFERVETEALVDAILLRMAQQISDRQATVAVERPLPIVRAHRATLQQCLVNLINNGLKFTPPGAPPRLRIGGRDATANAPARIWVEDEGIGIAPEHHERIFRVFERLHGAETYPGTGIGLAIVKKGIERMHGRVGVESTIGQGSRFWLELPAEVPVA